MKTLNPLFYYLKSVPLLSYLANTLFVAVVLAVIIILLAGESGINAQEREWWWNIH